MTSVQWQQVRDLFEQALERGTGAAAWVREVPADAEVTAEVASLLDQHARAGAFLEEPLVTKGAALLDDERFADGKVLGPYTIEREIGRGGMGRVYLATDARLGRRVALKALPPDLTRDPRQRERLRREARAAASLTHPGICTIYALEEIDDHVLIAAEYIDGHPLREEIGGALPRASDVLAAARELAGALAHAHAHGVVHRDLKPENIMRAPDGRLKILDFGLALVPISIAAAPRVTEPGALVGTPGYMSPEQLASATSDARSDQFALGAVVFEFAAGRHPFAAGHALGVIAKVLEGEPASLATARPDLPASLPAAIARCLRRNPADRFQTATEFLDALDIDAAVPAPVAGSRWWRYHQCSVLVLYMLAAMLTWQVKQWMPGLPRAVFLFVGVGATVGIVYRGHLLFTEAMNPPLFGDERRRAEPFTLVTDLLIGLALVIDGLWLATTNRPLAAMFTLGLGVILGLLRLVIERTTARAAFDTRTQP